MRSLFMPVPAILLLLCVAHAEEPRGRISVDTEGRLAYQHPIGKGFLIGTDLLYESIGEADSGTLMHWDQLPSLWLMTLGHRFEYRNFRVDNTVKYLGVHEFDWFTLVGNFEWSLRTGYRLSLTDRLDFFPALDLANYRYRWEPIKEPGRTEYNHAVTLKLGATLNFEYRL